MASAVAPSSSTVAAHIVFPFRELLNNPAHHISLDTHLNLTSKPTDDIASLLSTVDASSFTTSEDRKRAIDEARALLARLETPTEFLYRQFYIHPAFASALGTALNLHLFEKWATKKQSAPTSSAHLASLVSCQPDLLARILRLLAATQVVACDPSTDLYSMTAISNALATPPTRALADQYFHWLAKVSSELPAYLAATDYQTPNDLKNGPFKSAMGAEAFPWLQANPASHAVFLDALEASTPLRGTLVDHFPTEKMLERMHPDRPLLVDIGGGAGHDLDAFQKKHALPRGTLVLQDRPEVIKQADNIDPAIEKMAYDFFTPQPVRDASYYYFKGVLHDWPDSDCIRILSALKPAMKAGYSRLFIHDMVVDEHRPSAEIAACDMLMMGVTSSKERTDAEWRALLDQAGFKAVKIASHPEAVLSVIWAEPES